MLRVDDIVSGLSKKKHEETGTGRAIAEEQPEETEAVSQKVTEEYSFLWSEGIRLFFFPFLKSSDEGVDTTEIGIIIRYQGTNFILFQ